MKTSRKTKAKASVKATSVKKVSVRERGDSIGDMKIRKAITKSIDKVFKHQKGLVIVEAITELGEDGFKLEGTCNIKNLDVSTIARMLDTAFADNADMIFGAWVALKLTKELAKCKEQDAQANEEWLVAFKKAREANKK